jgi:hypothetical protein
MLHPPKIEWLLTECERVGLTLEEINPDHEHLQYDFNGKSEEEKDVLTCLFFQNFAPDNCDITNPTDVVIELTYASYLNALHTAVIIEKARLGFFGTQS